MKLVILIYLLSLLLFYFQKKEEVLKERWHYHCGLAFVVSLFGTIFAIWSMQFADIPLVAAIAINLIVFTIVGGLWEGYGLTKGGVWSNGDIAAGDIGGVLGLLVAFVYFPQLDAFFRPVYDIWLNWFYSTT